MNMKTLLTTVIIGTLCQFTAGVSQAQDAGATPPAAAKTTAKPSNVKRGPREVIADKIRTEVAKKLKEAGASCDDLQVTVAVNRDSATPFQVSERPRHSGWKREKNLLAKHRHIISGPIVAPRWGKEGHIRKPCPTIN